MELTSKIASLEEEINVLKGEIKTILQEVRAALLARENPFSLEAFEPLQPQDLPSAVHTPGPAGPQAPSLPATESPPEAAAEHEVQAAPRALPQEAPQGAGERPAWSVQSLAMLAAWVQDTAARLAPADLEVLLALARYGRLIDAELETLVANLAARHAPETKEPARAGVNDYVLVLRQLAALAGPPREDDFGSGRLRLAS